MDSSVEKQIEGLRRLSTRDMRVKYREVFGEEPRSQHREPLFRWLAWRLQALASGGLSERARQRAAAIANEADLRVLAPRRMDFASFASAPRPYDRRIPRAGATLTRQYRGNTIAVQVLTDGFQFQGRLYRSLSAIALAATGTRWNGLAFFGLTEKNGPGKVRHGVQR